MCVRLECVRAVMGRVRPACTEHSCLCAHDMRPIKSIYACFMASHGTTLRLQRLELSQGCKCVLVDLTNRIGGKVAVVSEVSVLEVPKKNQWYIKDRPKQTSMYAQ